jgi:hypothetical protein
MPDKSNFTPDEWKLLLESEAWMRTERAKLSRHSEVAKACDLMRQNCRVDYITGPSNERINVSAIESWCKSHPNRRQPEGR